MDASLFEQTCFKAITTIQCVISDTVPGDELDNDCDDKFDEEIRDGKDNDGDGKIDEDLQVVNFENSYLNRTNMK